MGFYDDAPRKETIISLYLRVCAAIRVGIVDRPPLIWLMFTVQSRSDPRELTRLSHLSEDLPPLGEDEGTISKSEYMQILRDADLLDRHLLICRKYAVLAEHKCHPLMPHLL